MSQAGCKSLVRHAVSFLWCVLLEKLDRTHARSSFLINAFAASQNLRPSIQHTMGGGRNPHREEQVKGLNVVALAHGKAAIRETAGRPLVRDLVAELLRLELTAAQRDKVSQLSASYEASFGEAGEGPQPEANEDAGRQGFSLVGGIHIYHIYCESLVFFVLAVLWG